MEILDLYDVNRKKMNKKIIRGQKPDANEYCLVVGIWITNGKGQLLTTLRAPQKRTYPNLWENTGGMVQSGESSIQGALRELREETGIHTEVSELILLASHIESTAIVDQYLVVKDIPVSDICLQEGETAVAKWVFVQEFVEMITQGLVAKPIADRFKKIKQHLINM